MSAEAWALLENGQLAAVDALLRQWQATGPFDATQWHLAGALALARGSLPEAAQALQASLALQAGNAEALYQLGRVMKEAGHLAEAMACYDRALAQRPDFWQALSSRGIAARAAGLVQEAVASFEQAIALRGRDAGLLMNLANALLASTAYARAAATYREVLGLRPGDQPAARGLAEAVLGERLLAAQWDEALAAAAALDAASPLRALGAGIALLRLGRTAEAAPQFAAARELPLRDAVLCWRCGDVLENVGRAHQEAVFWFGRAAALLGEAAGPALYTSIALAEVNAGAFEAADEALERALTLDPDDANALWQRALLALWRDDYSAGFAGYEQRFRAVFANAPGFTAEGRLPLGGEPWRGEPLAGRRLLVWAEQGLGDTLQFCRFLPPLLARHARARLDVLVQDELVGLLRASFPGLALHGLREAGQLPRPDLEAAIMSLPLLLGLEEQTRPLALPYLQPDQALVAQWRARLGPRERLRVGLVWAGNPRHGRDLERSLPLSALQGLGALDIEYHALQKGEAAAQRWPSAGNPLRDTAPALADFHDTAAVLANLDLVITVDTAMAHLAGGLGVPTFLLLNKVGEWRWGRGRQHCRWYDSLRFFRQREDGDWHAVIEAVRQALVELTAHNAVQS